MPLSRAEMEAVIAGGGSVLIGGRIIARAEDLPGEAELAQGDPAAEAAATDKLRTQMAALQEQLTALQEQQSARAAPAEEPAPAKAPKGKPAPPAEE